MRLGSLTRQDLIFPDLPASDRDGVLRALAGRVAAQGAVPDGDELHRKLAEREGLGSTGIGGGIAIPHCKLERLAKGVVAVGLVPGGVDFGAVDGRPVRLFFLVVSPSDSPAGHLQVLAAISRWVKTGGHAERLLELHDPAAIQDLLDQES